MYFKVSGSSVRRVGATLIVSILLALAPGWDAAWAGEAASGAEAAPDAPPTKAAAAPSSPEYEKHWYLAVGTSNHHPKLGESEPQIDEQINGLFGLIPGWKKPVTFEDWADDFKLWDATIGVGRDITPKTAWMAWTGGATATIKSKERYGLLDTDIRFSRTTAFVTLQGYVYPFGKPDLEAQAVRGLKASTVTAIREVRPYLTLATGYLFVRAKGDVRVELPLAGRVFRQKQVDDHHLYMVSPKAGIEFPVSQHNTISLEGAYYFFGPDHEDEYNGMSYYVGFKHRF